MNETVPSIYVYVSVGLCLCSFAIQLFFVLYRSSAKLSYARISFYHGVIKIRLHLQKPLKVEAGQYISLWMPYASLWSLTQVHPFTVVSWSNQPQSYLDLFVQPRKGITKDIVNLATYGATTSIAAFSGPHGIVLPVHKYENILMLATGFGIAAHLPYLKMLINNHHHRGAPTRQIHLVWYIGELGASYFIM